MADERFAWEPGDIEFDGEDAALSAEDAGGYVVRKPRETPDVHR